MAVESRRLGIRSSPVARTTRRIAGADPRLRVAGLGLAIALLATTIWARLVYWQVIESHQLSTYAADQYQHEVPLPATRGVIYDRELRPLAVNVTVYSVFVSPSNVPAEARPAVADGLSRVLGVDRSRVLQTLESGGQFTYIARRQPKDKADQIAALRLPGVGLEPEQQRSYLPGGSGQGTLAANLLGFVNYDGKGQYGVEGYYDSRLAGKAGYKTSYTDAAGRDIALGPSERVNPVNGSDIVLTIDAGVQYAAEQALAAGVKANHADSGSVIVMDPKTGEVIAWADYPTYDANQFTTADPATVRDSIVADLYEPGSIMKVPTLSGALDAHAITPTTTINDPGYIAVGGYTLHDWDLKNHGTVTMTRVLEESYNVGAVRAEQMEGADAFYHYLQAFGFGHPSDVDVAGEASQPLAPRAQWPEVQLATAAYGQGISVNIVQMAAAVNVIANGGRWAQPHVADSIGGRPSPLASAPQPQVVSPQAAAQMSQMMESVVQHGSGYTARVAGFELDEAGKTGTSQMPEKGGYSADHVWASYAGFLPAQNPRFTMLVVLRKPNNGSFDHNEGYYVSAPIWKQIAESMVLQWRIAPDPPAAKP
jgi:stage V sporulation protein D (sporulation-specific penicillin-binding protein)